LGGLLAGDCRWLLVEWLRRRCRLPNLGVLRVFAGADELTDIGGSTSRILDAPELTDFGVLSLLAWLKRAERSSPVKRTWEERP
jgi:hypothetical protein